MPVRAPLVEAEQNGSICIQDLAKVVMARTRLGLAEERLVPFEAAGNIPYTDDCPSAFHGLIRHLNIVCVLNFLAIEFCEQLPVTPKRKLIISSLILSNPPDEHFKIPAVRPIAWLNPLKQNRFFLRR
jgi:hypothetical protein